MWNIRSSGTTNAEACCEMFENWNCFAISFLVELNWRVRTSATVASVKDDQMSETMINYRNLPNLHLFGPFFCIRAWHHPSSILIYRCHLFFWSYLKPILFPISVSAIIYKKRAEARKNAAKNTSKAPEEVDLTVKPIPPSTVVEQPKNLWTFILNILVYTNTTKLFSNILAMPFGAFKYYKFIT